MGKFVQMNASLSKSTLKFLVYRASVASLAAPLRTPEPTLCPLRDHPYFFFAVPESLFFEKFLSATGLELGTCVVIMNHQPSVITTKPQKLENYFTFTFIYKRIIR